MIVSTLLGLSLLGHIRHPFGLPQQSTRVYSAGGWILGLQRDNFTGRLRCELQTPRFGPARIRYRQGALAFYLGPGVNTLDAWYRIDGGPARRSQDLYPALVHAGAQYEGPSLDNPTGGVVVLPRSEVGTARVVLIRAKVRAQPRSFKVRDFPAALEAASRQVCTDAAFLR